VSRSTIVYRNRSRELQQTWAQLQAIAGRMQTPGVTLARSVRTHPSRSVAAPTRSPDRGFGR